MPGPSLVPRLFWTTVTGGAAALRFGTPALVATGAVLALILLHRLDRPRRFRSLAARLTRRHAGILALRRRQECYRDAYGNLIRDGWERERDYFVERTLLPALEKRGFAEAQARWNTLAAIVEAAARSVRLAEADDAPEDGIAYERFCARLLREAGWNASPTRASGDQGADVVAERDGIRLVVQCKRTAKPVGNAAVQEVAAAARYWSGEMAAVVASAGFTPAARKLAAATGVLLLHHDDLAALEPSIRPRRERA